MENQPSLTTDRLVLRPFELTDAPVVASLAGDATVAAMTLLIPHPYELKHAIDWIGTHSQAYQSGTSAQFAVTHRETNEVMGSIGIDFFPRHAKAEVGYWIGRPFWSRGYATEAGRAVLRWAFESRGVERIESFCFTNNAASARVLEKIGFVQEGIARAYVKKESTRRDCTRFAALRTEFA